jgi:hypothetical protein
MKIFVRVLLLGALLALGIWSWTILFPSPEKQVRKRIAEVASLASFSTGEGLVRQGLRVQSLANCFGAKVEVTIDLPGNQHHELAGRDEITQTALLARQNFRWLKIELLDPTVVLSADKQTAVVNLTLRVRFPDQRDIVVQEMKFSLQKADREWLIIRIETVRTLSRGHPGGSFVVFSGLNRNLNLSLNRSFPLPEQIKSKRKIKIKTAGADGTA